MCLYHYDFYDNSINLADKFWQVWKTNYYFWPLYNFLNFKYVSLGFRIFAINIGSFFWNMYLSYVNSQ